MSRSSKLALTLISLVLVSFALSSIKVEKYKRSLGLIERRVQAAKKETAPEEPVQEVSMAEIDESALDKIYLFIRPTALGCARDRCTVDVKKPDGRHEVQILGAGGDFHIPVVYLPGDWVTVVDVR